MIRLTIGWRLDWRVTAIVALIGVITVAVIVQTIHQRQVARVERAKAEEAEREQAVAQVRLRQLAARLEEVQGCHSEPRLGEPQAILRVYAECFGARIQRTRVLGCAPVRVYVVTGGGSWTVEGGTITGYQK